MFGWFENDVYVGLLMIAAHLTLGRLARADLPALPAVSAQSSQPAQSSGS